MRKRRLSILTLLISGLFAACGGSGGSSTTQGPPPPTGNSVTVSPATATVSKGGTQQFSATISGATDQTVQWEVNGSVGGDAAHGLISEGGVYIAPTTLPNPASVTVTAVDFADPTKTGTAAVTLQSGSGVSVVIAGSSSLVSVPTFGTQQFVATVTGTTNTALTWQVNGAAGGSATTGSISSTGLYTAPNSVPVSTMPNNDGQTTDVLVTAVSQADSTASDTADVIIFPPQQNAQILPTPLGVSGSNGNDTSTVSGQTFCCGGTIGALVSRGNNQYILSNNHVMARSDQGSIGDPIVQPGLIDNNCSSSGVNTVAKLSQFYNLENGSAPAVDAALAQAVSGSVNASGSILQLGAANNGSQPTDGPPNAGSGVTASVGMTVAKSGRATGLTCAAVTSVNTSTSVQYQKGCGTGSTFTVTYSNQVDIGNGTFSAEGDSGSLVVTQSTADAVGLMFAGSDVDTVANPISDVLRQLADPSSGAQPVFVGGSPHAVAACSLPGPQAGIRASLAVQRAEPNDAIVQQAAAARDAQAPQLMSYPEVQAVGVGASLDNPADPAIIFFVTQGQSHSDIPAQVSGVRTRIVEAGFFPKRGTISRADTILNEQSSAPPQYVAPISDAELARAKIVHTAHVNDLMKEPGVQGVGISSSIDASGEAALMIFLIRGVAHNPIPALIDGLRTRVHESSRFRAGVRTVQPHHVCSMPASATTAVHRAPLAAPSQK